MVFVPAIVVVMVVLCVQKVNFDIMVKYLGHTFTYREFIEISTTSPWRYQTGAWHWPSSWPFLWRSCDCQVKPKNKSLDSHLPCFFFSTPLKMQVCTFCLLTYFYHMCEIFRSVYSTYTTKLFPIAFPDNYVLIEFTELYSVTSIYLLDRNPFWGD